MEENSISYFRNLWQTTVTELENQCEIWEDICQINTVPDIVQEEIRSTIGLSRLLKNQKLKQFRGLIDDSEFNTGEKEITCLDLAGFWDMIYNEVEKIKKSFNSLQDCKNNEWQFVEKNLENVPKKKAVHTVPPKKKTESSKSHALAARQRLAEIKKKMLAQREQIKEQNFVENESSKESTENGHVKKENIAENKTKSTIATSMQPLNGPKKSPKRTKVNSPTTDITASLKESQALSNAHKNTPIQRKGRVSAKDKENATPADDDGISKVKKSKETQRTPAEKKEKKSKEPEIIKLQCVTRSAKKKALLAQKNAKEKL